ncbi:hypothetical protein ACFLYP_01805 [Chloroflexota bacterium]
MNTNNIIITVDTDWAANDVLEDVLFLLVEYNIKATIFATNKSKALDALDPQQFEIGLHPNFGDQLNVEETILKLKADFPNATSLRSHTLLHSSRFFPVYKISGILYTSNYLSLGSKHLSPITQPFGIIEVPIFFIDDAYLIMNEEEDKFDLSSIDLKSPGLKVFAFHPIHIFLNTESSARYQESKEYHNDITMLKKIINPGKGTRSLFISLMQYIAENGIKTSTLSQYLERNL